MPEQADHGSFLTGFTIGLFAGAAGYFLFATDKGEKARKALSKEWQEAQQSWFTSQEVGPGTSSLRELAKDFFGTLLQAESIANRVSKESKMEKDKKSSVAKKSAPATLKRNTFKGV
jgi:gas vesicle protein